MSLTTDDWLRSCEEAVSASHRLRAVLRARDEAGTKREMVDHEVEARRLLKFVTGRCDGLRDELDALESGSGFVLTRSELGRRRAMVDALGIACGECSGRIGVRPAHAYSERDRLLESDQQWGGGGRGGGGGVGSLVEKERGDDAYLDELYASLVRQQDIGEAIGKETDRHIVLLSDMAEHADLTEQRVAHEGERIEEFRVKSSACVLWIIIALLVVIVILLAATDGGCRIIHSKSWCESHRPGDSGGSSHDNNSTRVF